MHKISVSSSTTIHTALKGRMNGCSPGVVDIGTTQFVHNGLPNGVTTLIIIGYGDYELRCSEIE